MKRGCALEGHLPTSLTRKPGDPPRDHAEPVLTFPVPLCCSSTLGGFRSQSGHPKRTARWGELCPPPTSCVHIWHL